MSLSAAFTDQAISCARLGSPFMGQLLSLLADHWPNESAIGARFAEFDGDIGPSGHSLPLRIAGGLHALVLSAKAPDLIPVYPPNRVSDDVLRDAVLFALQEHQDFLLDWVQNPPQTNEVRRSAALMPGAAVAAAYFDLPVVLSELGASGGLNLKWDFFALELPNAKMGSKTPALTLKPEWEGPLPPLRLPEIAARAGVDLNPLNPSHDADLLRLMAYLWPDQPDRLALTRAAAGALSVDIARADAIDWLESRLTSIPAGHLHIIQNTVAWQYFPASVQARGVDMIQAAGAKATPDSPLAWLTLESDGDTRGALGGALTLRLWPGDITINLGRADFHGRWVKWYGPEGSK